MSHIHRSIWNATLGCWLAGPETAHAAGCGAASKVTQAWSWRSVSPVRKPTVALASLVGGVACTMAAPSYAQIYNGNQTLDASVANAVSTGARQFYDLSTLNASAGNAVSGGTQRFYNASILNASAGNAVSGGEQRFYDYSILNASAANAVSGGSQNFSGNSSLNASAGNAVSGGFQNFFQSSSMNALAGNAVSGGFQSFFENSSLNASAANAVSGGEQQFYDDSILNASVAFAVSGGEVRLFDNAVIKVNFENALTKNAVIYFQGLFSGTGTGRNQLLLNGYSTTVGAIQSQTAGSGVIENRGSSAAMLTVDSSKRGDSYFSGTIKDGSAVLGLTKAGAGTLTLSGANTFTGGTILNGGMLVAAHSDALGAGNVTVGSGAALEVSRGTTLAVVGNLAFQSDATYRVYADPNSATSSRIDVTGNAYLAGSVLHVGNESNSSTDFQVGKTYTILTANQINGTFARAASSFAYLDARLDYLIANQVNLTLRRKSGMSFADLGSTSNQTSAANAIESLPSTHPLYQYVETLPIGAPAEVFSSLSGDAHSSVMGSVSRLNAQVPSIIRQHMHGKLAAGLRAGAPIAQSDGPLPASAFPLSKALPAWVEVVGHWQKMDGNSNAPEVKQNTTGLFLGADQEVGSSGWRVGGSVGYTNADANVSRRDTSADISNYSAAVYTGKSFAHGANRVNVLSGLAYTHHSIESERTVPSLGQNLKADYSGHTAQLFAEVGYAMGQYDKQGVEPFVGITLGEQRIDGFQERGGFAALSSQSNSDTLASTTLGVHAHSDFKLAGKDTRVLATLGVRHAWGSLSQSRTMAFEGSSSFTVAGAPLARNTALVGLQAEMELSRRAALVFGYNGELGSSNRDHSANLKLRWAY